MSDVFIEEEVDAIPEALQNLDKLANGINYDWKRLQSDDTHDAFLARYFGVHIYAIERSRCTFLLRLAAALYVSKN